MSAFISRRSWPERDELQRRLQAKVTVGKISFQAIDIEDLQDFNVLKNRNNLSTGKLSRNRVCPENPGLNLKCSILEPMQRRSHARESFIFIGLAVFIAALVLTYIQRGVIMGWQFSKGQAAFWDILVKAVAGLFGISGALLTIRKYLDEKKRSNTTTRREARKDFSLKQQEVYFDLIDAISNIANNVKGDPTKPEEERARIEADKKFWHIYWGPITMVEDSEVAKAVDDFSIALYETPDAHPLLLNKSIDLARACRASLGVTWRVTQVKLPDRKPGIRS